MALCCLLPFVLVLSASFTSESSILESGYKLIPDEFSLEAYKTLFLSIDQIIDAYKVSFIVTVLGTVAGLFLIAMTGYVLCRKDFRYREQISFFIYFTTLFSGGIIPTYLLMVKYLHLKDTYASMILPYLMSPFLIVLMKSFMKSIPEAISESGKIDGASDFTIFIRLILPLAKPALATIGLFLALQYWNDWYLASIYMTTPEKYPLQFYLYNILKRAEFFTTGLGTSVAMVGEIPMQSVKMATAVVTTGPIIFLYPFVQKHFVKGITVGAVKG